MKDRHAWAQIVAGLGIALPPLQQEGYVLPIQNNKRIGNDPLAISATVYGTLYVILPLPKVSQAFESAGPNQGPYHILISKYQVKPLSHTET